MGRPVVIVNFKTYPDATGQRALDLAQMCERLGQEFDVDVRVAVQTADILRVAQVVSIKVYAQHVTAFEPGRNTGYSTVESIKDAGAAGSFLNHSEHRMSEEDVLGAARRLAAQGMDAILFTDDAAAIKHFDQMLTPTFFCIEPPDLIAGDVSVSSSRPELIKDAVSCTPTPVLVGAGIKDKKDLDIALSLGAKGVALASGVVVADDKERALRGLLSGQ
ncbi:triose-phosphate isomerase [Candidatus Woesearchaeota archaeon]|nr:triose-phosphate isomerase [Candidatus Woesearchaeota archaeon]